MKAVDTKILVYAHRLEAPRNEEASAYLRALCEGQEAWAIPWPCISEFYTVVTNTRIWKTSASSLAQAMREVSAWCASPSVVLLSEVESSLALLSKLLLQSKVTGGAVHDARIVALCLAHGVGTLVTADRDFSRFPGVRSETPW